MVHGDDVERLVLVQVGEHEVADVAVGQRVAVGGDEARAAAGAGRGKQHVALGGGGRVDRTRSMPTRSLRPSPLTSPTVNERTPRCCAIVGLLLPTAVEKKVKCPVPSPRNVPMPDTAARTSRWPSLFMSATVSGRTRAGP